MWTYNGASQNFFNTFHFGASFTPVVTHIAPLIGLPGELINIHGSHFDSGPAATDTNFYMVCTIYAFFTASTAKNYPGPAAADTVWVL